MTDLNPIDILGNSSIGIFGMATDKYAIVPYNIKKNVFEVAEKTLEVPIIRANIANSNLAGLFLVGNSNHLVLPSVVTDDEFEHLRNSLDASIEINFIESKITALGNAVVASDKLALVHPEFSSEDRKDLRDLLDVEIVSQPIMNSPLVGSLIFRNELGLLTHPLISDEELNWLVELF